MYNYIYCMQDSTLYICITIYILYMRHAESGYHNLTIYTGD